MAWEYRETDDNPPGPSPHTVVSGQQQQDSADFTRKAAALGGGT